MSPSVEFLIGEEVAAIQEDQVGRYGGSAGIRDLGLLESAVLAPEFAAYYTGSSDLLWLAAVHMVRLIQDPPFVDSNKRTGVVVARVFLQLNGIRLSGVAKYTRELEELAVHVAQRRAGEEAVADLFWRRAKKK